jgi:hypothetical protein
MGGFPQQRSLDELQAALESDHRTGGTTHDFYHYPARFSPEIARCVIETFSARDEYILDPFMGGGTAIIEGLLLGRRMIGLDVNSLGHFVAGVRTRPLSVMDEDRIRRWARQIALQPFPGSSEFQIKGTANVRNLPNDIRDFMSTALGLALKLCPRRRAFARCALLRLGQRLLDSRSGSMNTCKLGVRLAAIVDEMLDGLADFVSQCHSAGIGKRQILQNCLLLNRSAINLDTDRRMAPLSRRTKLVFTSPPYPGVHVLYHRWQYRGRKETPAPYWIANLSDGHGPSLYNGGSRTPTGLINYFAMITEAFRSIARFAAPNAWIVQLVGFSDAKNQLPIYLDCMSAAGLAEEWIGNGADERLVRRVPNRKWYAELQGQVDASKEYLLVHRIRKRLEQSQ